MNDSIKLREDAYNSMPGSSTILKLMEKCGIHEAAMIKDYYAGVDWKNKEDTLVIAFSANCTMGVGCGLAKFLDQCGANEFEVDYDGQTDCYITKFWWD